MPEIDQMTLAVNAYTGHRYGRLLGRGTTALYVAFRALAIINGPGEIVLPDLICSTVLDAVLLAGHKPIFADILPGRWTLDPLDARRKITSQTRAVLVAHLYGHVADVPCHAFANLGVPIVEDAIQGLGGDVGRIGDITVLGFADSKMISGRGGAVMTNNPDLWDVIHRVDINESFAVRQSFSHHDRFQNYRPQLIGTAPELLRDFDSSMANMTQIERGWQTLADNVWHRNSNSAYLSERLIGANLQLPIIRPRDAVWRYTFAAPSVISASWIARHLQQAGLPGSRLYPSLSAIFAPDDNMRSVTIAPRLINLWVDATVNHAALDQMLSIVRSAPAVQLTAGV